MDVAMYGIGRRKLQTKITVMKKQIITMALMAMTMMPAMAQNKSGLPTQN